MPKFRISYTTEDWWNLDVEADNIDDAMEKFHMGWWKHDDAAIIEGGYLQDSVDIRPLED